MDLHLFSLAGSLTLLGLLVVAVTLGCLAAPLWAWTATVAAGLFLFSAPTWLLITAATVAAFLHLPLLRLSLSALVMSLLRRLQFLPEISETERQAIEAGETWLEAELFSGRPDLHKLANSPYGTLSADEQAFLDNQTEEVCRMVDDWDTHQRRDLLPEVWTYLKREGFFGMIIPKQYGGLGFSPSANSAVVAKLSSRSMPLAVTVMVPNSLGPAELLIHYGTQAQRDHYLPRLARGEDMPCFALTEPGAGSDAGAMAASGEVFRGEDGALRIRLNWEKRYITLAGVSTVLGLAFKLRDPQNLLGKGEHPGITCALVPTATPGIDVSRRHDALGTPFYNCPTTGRDVIVSVDAIIGGPDGAGRGWLMLMECLAAGRGISLPAVSTGTTKLALRVASAHAVARRQFGVSIGRFEGIEEPLARIAGTAYVLEAARRFTCGGLDSGVKPPVATAMCKYQFTDLARAAVTDATDILGGNAIAKGPRNLLAPIYTALPICITVEGANILTRTLMVFGQGAIRCHPYAFAEIDALGKGDVRAFDKAFWPHVGHVVKNGCRALALTLTRGALVKPPVLGPAARHYHKLAWASASFAFWADIAMGTLGGDLKRKEKLTGRFADVFSWMYLATATLRRFVHDGQRKDDLPLLEWAMAQAFDRMQVAFDGLYANLPLPGLRWLLRGPIAAWSRLNRFCSAPNDRVTAAAAQVAQQPGSPREALTGGIYVPRDEREHLAALDRAMTLVVEAEAVVRKVKVAMRGGQLPRGRVADLLDQALVQGVLTPEEVDLVGRAERQRAEVCQVDSFSASEYMATARRARGSDKPVSVSS